MTGKGQKGSPATKKLGERVIEPFPDSHAPRHTGINSLPIDQEGEPRKGLFASQFFVRSPQDFIQFS
jgi:hypothetical protein